jgi:hypothetical protein
MPNHVYSAITVYGKEDKIKIVQDEFRGEDKNQHISFDRIIPRPESEEENWRDWSIKNWGTKWDAYEQPEEKPRILGEPNSLKYIKDEETLALIIFHFLTAWSPVPKVLEVLSLKYPHCIFKYAYLEEGEGFSGVDFWHQGDLVKEKQLRPKNQVFFGDSETDVPKLMREFKSLKIKIP